MAAAVMASVAAVMPVSKTDTKIFIGFPSMNYAKKCGAHRRRTDLSKAERGADSIYAYAPRFV